jgi:putative transposase
VKTWQARPFEPVYPILYLDALVVKVRDNHQVRNKAAHIAVGVDCDGIKHVLGIWVQPPRGRSFGLGCSPSSATAGVQDVLIACCDGLTGFSRGDRGHLAAHRRPNVRGPFDPGLDAVHLLQRPQSCRRRDAADLHRPHRGLRGPRVGHLRRLHLGKKYPATGKVWRAAWQRFIPFLEFAPEVRKIIYTTNAIESLN